ncbi:MAG: DUF5615 family PIN-like protein [Enhydrobacter sp.]|nr:MAG: DUF5615 family PIN-like protein [Enhydrobacter sp.]
MRFLADENFPGAAVTALEAAGHDVVWVGQPHRVQSIQTCWHGRPASSASS